MSAHTIYDELGQLAKKLGIDIRDTHNIKDIIRRMNQYFGGDSNGHAISDAIRNMYPMVPYDVAPDLTLVSLDDVDIEYDIPGSKYEYHGSATEETTTALTYTPASGSTAIATFKGETVESGSEVTLTEGLNDITIVVSKNGCANRIYNITVTVTVPSEEPAEESDDS